MTTASGYARIRPARVLVAVLVPLSLGAASAVLAWASTAPISAVRAPGPAPVDAMLALGASGVCAALLAVTAVGATISLAALLRGQVSGRAARLARRLTPQVVHATLGLAVGAVVVSAPLAGPAIGKAGAPAHHPVANSASRAAMTPALPEGWTPDRPAMQASGRPTPVEVKRGDTLWDIAARRLGRGASNAHVAAEWPRWHALNRATIGPDPDLIFPGQRLTPPPRRQQRDRKESL